MTREQQDAAAVAWLLMVRRYGLAAIRPVPTDTGIMHGPGTPRPRPVAERKPIR